MGIQAKNIARGPLVNGNHNPDFIAQINESKIGVEETTYYRQQRKGESYPRQLKESAWQDLRDIIENKRKNHVELNEIYGTVRFGKFLLPPSKEYDSFADELVKFAISKVEELSDDFKRYKAFDYEYTHLRKYVEYFELQKVVCYMFWDWRHRADSVGLQKDELCSVIQAKIDKYTDCQANENWLLVTSGTQISQQMGRLCVGIMNEWKDVFDLLDKSPFDKVYVYDYMRSRIVLYTKVGRWKKIETNNT